MSNLLRFHPTTMRFLPVCVTDCYPGTRGDFDTNSMGGVYLNHSEKVIDVDAACNGRAAGELGGLAFSNDGYQLVFNAHQNPATPGANSYDEATMNQDIGLAAIGSSLQSNGVVWLTDTPSIEEADSTIERWTPAGESIEQYVVGWVEPSGDSREHMLARIDASGAFLEGPVSVGALARWGRRDDPFRRHANGDVVWAWFDAAGSTTLHVARLRSGSPAP
jgi:hypothetical protein